jgi:uncharacterized protein (TIGR01244 family)
MSGTQAKLWLDIPNCCTPSDGLCTGGHPQPEHLREAQKRGVRTVINLRPITEHADFDEAGLVASLGMTYVNIPITGPGDLTPANAQKLADALKTAGDGPTLVHCASGNRVGALFALKAHYLDGQDIDTALMIGRGTGLKAMEPTVRQILSS